MIAVFSFEHYILKTHLPYLFTPSNLLPILPKSFGLVILINVVMTTLTLFKLGMNVSKTRTQCKELAKKEDNDKDAEERYSYPKLYAEGFSKNAKLFNCVQRAHQQAFETYPQFLAMSLLGSLQFPISVSLAGLLWNYSRVQWASGYASGEPSKRYDHWSAYGIWSSLVMLLFASTAVAISFLL